MEDNRWQVTIVRLLFWQLFHLSYFSLFGMAKISSLAKFCSREWASTESKCCFLLQKFHLQKYNFQLNFTEILLDIPVVTNRINSCLVIDVFINILIKILILFTNYFCLYLWIGIWQLSCRRKCVLNKNIWSHKKRVLVQNILFHKEYLN